MEVKFGVVNSYTPYFTTIGKKIKYMELQSRKFFYQFLLPNFGILTPCTGAIFTKFARLFYNRVVIKIWDSLNGFWSKTYSFTLGKVENLVEI